MGFPMSVRLLSAYLPTDRCQALAHSLDLPEHTSGAALFADISGFTPLTEALARELGDRRGSEELTRQLNRVYGALIAEVDRFSGSVISFSGDAITCWFDSENVGLIARAVGQPVPHTHMQPLPLAALRAVACALAMQAVMQQFATITTPGGSTVALAIKVGIAAGAVRRFVVGDPALQLVDALAGATMVRLAAAEHAAYKGEVVIGEDVAEIIGEHLELYGWRTDDDARFAVVIGLRLPAPERPWLALPDALLSEDRLRP